VLHRDLKSPNLLVDSNWTVKLCDFGLSRFANDGASATLQKVRGTYTHSPPEVFHGQSYTPKSDIYSLGVIFWELVNRCLKGRYEAPFSEYAKLKFDFQILLQASGRVFAVVVFAS
jgi:serine/threonine protein kinase